MGNTFCHGRAYCRWSGLIFLYLLENSIAFINGLPSWRFFLLPIGLLVSAFLIKKLAPEAEGHGTEKVIEAIHFKQGLIPLRVVPVKLVATIVTLASGGSVGEEGPSVQIGGGLMSWIAQILRLDVYDRKNWWFVAYRLAFRQSLEPQFRVLYLESRCYM